jgi:hypothetical protein
MGVSNTAQALCSVAVMLTPAVPLARVKGSSVPLQLEVQVTRPKFFVRACTLPILAMDDEIDFSKLAIGSVVPGTVPVISMDFHEKGELCVTTASDSSIVLVNALEGKVRKVVHSQKYGTGTIRYTHHDQVSCE